MFIFDKIIQLILVLSQNILKFQNNQLINNSATIGGAIKFEKKIINFDSNLYKNNWASLYGNNLASYPLKMNLSQETIRTKILLIIPIQ